MTILKQNWSQIYSKLLNVALGGLCPPKPPTRLCPCTTEPLPRWNNIVSYAPVIVLFCYLYMCNIFTKSYKVILHQFWVKNFFPWKFNLEYGITFTKLFMHVSSQNMLPTTKNLQIRVPSSPLLWRLIYIRLFCSDDCRSWPREEMINNHGCWGKHAHIPDNDYWGICLFHVVWTNFFFCNYSYVVHTKYIFIFSHQLNIAHER